MIVQSLEWEGGGDWLKWEWGITWGWGKCSKTTLQWWLPNSVHLRIITEFHNICYTSLKLLNINSADKLVEAAFMSQSQYYSFRGALSGNIIQSTPLHDFCYYILVIFNHSTNTNYNSYLYWNIYLLYFPWLKCKLHEGRYFIYLIYHFTLTT